VSAEAAGGGAPDRPDEALATGGQSPLSAPAAAPFVVVATPAADTGWGHRRWHVVDPGGAVLGEVQHVPRGPLPYAVPALGTFYARLDDAARHLVARSWVLGPRPAEEGRP
jgi:hypothetical protein